MGELGPDHRPLVALGNSISAGDDFNKTLANMVGAFFNGADLNLDSLIPAIEQAGILPAGMNIENLDIAFGGLLSPGEVAIALARRPRRRRLDLQQPWPRTSPVFLLLGNDRSCQPGGRPDRGLGGLGADHRVAARLGRLGVAVGRRHAPRHPHRLPRRQHHPRRSSSGPVQPGARPCPAASLIDRVNPP